MHRSDFYYLCDIMQRDPKYKVIVRFIEDRIRRGELKTGDRLPSVNALRIRFSLSRSSIFLAMEELKSRGIVEAEPAVGYYVRSTNVEVQEKVLLLFNEFNAFKEDLYQSFLSAVNPDVSVDIMYQSYDRRVFETLLKEANGKYTSYVLMPGKFRGLSPLLDSIRGRVFLMDHFQDDIRGRYPGVGQDFEQDTYDALVQGLLHIRKYDTLILVQREPKEPEERYDGIKRFCDEYGFNCLLMPRIREGELRRNTLYLTANDRELVNLIKLAEAAGLEIGNDIGIISYNDTPLKEVLLGGITTLSTDFRQMGRTMAGLISRKVTPSTDPVPTLRNPWMLQIRKSL